MGLIPEFKQFLEASRAPGFSEPGEGKGQRPHTWWDGPGLSASSATHQRCDLEQTNEHLWASVGWSVKWDQDRHRNQRGGSWPPGLPAVGPAHPGSPCSSSRGSPALHPVPGHLPQAGVGEGLGGREAQMGC